MKRLSVVGIVMFLTGLLLGMVLLAPFAATEVKAQTEVEYDIIEIRESHFGPGFDLDFKEGFAQFSLGKGFQSSLVITTTTGFTKEVELLGPIVVANKGEVLIIPKTSSNGLPPPPPGEQ